MSDPKHLGNQEVTFVLNDQTTVVKMVKKTTTCADVINTLPPQPERLSVFDSVGGVEKELPGKTRILKVWRTQGAKSGVQFVIKKSCKLGRHQLIISKVKAKLGAFSRRLSISSNKNNRINHVVSSTSTRVAMDRSLANPDVENVTVLSSSGGLTCGQLPVTNTPRCATIAATTRSMINRHVVGDSLTTMKLAFQKAVASNVTVRSSGRDGRVDDKKNIRRRTIVQCDYVEYPLHSTPVVAVTGRGKRHAVLQLTSTPKSAQPSNKNNMSNHVPSTSTRVVMDRSLANPDVKNVSVFSSDGGVTCGQLPVTSTPIRATIAATTISRINRQAMADSLTTMKLAFRKAATSNVTVRSGRGDRVDDNKNIRRRTIVQCDDDEYPLHSTPVVAVTGRGKRRAVLQLTSTPKSAQPSRRYNTQTRHRVSAFPGTDGGRTGNQTCGGDSSFDSNTSCASSKLEVAFWDPLIPEMSVQPGLSGNQWTGTGGTGFDYSFDCTYPVMTDSYQAGLCDYGSDGERCGAESDDGLEWH